MKHVIHQWSKWARPFQNARSAAAFTKIQNILFALPSNDDLLKLHVLVCPIDSVPKMENNTFG